MTDAAQEKTKELANEVCYQLTGKDWGRSAESASLYRFLYPIVFAALSEVRADALEEAAKIAERPWDYCPTEDGYKPLYCTALEIAENIRSLRKDCEKQGGSTI